MSRTRVKRLLLTTPALALALGWSATASAKDLVVAPLISKGVDPLIVLNMTSLISSELDFMGEYGTVTQLEELPASLNSRCLSSGSCLSQIGKTKGAGSTVTGAVALVGNKFDLFLVLAEDGVVVRTIEKKMPNIPSVIADSMGGYVKELVTGVSARQEAQADDLSAMTLSGSDIFDDEDDVFEIDLSSGGGDRDDFEDLEDLGDFNLDGPPEREEPVVRREPDPPPRRQAEAKPKEEPEEEVMFAPVSAADVQVEDVQFGSAASQIVLDLGGDDDDDDIVVVDDYDDDRSSSRSSSRYDDDRSSSRSSSRYDDDDRDSRSSSRSSSRYDDDDRDSRSSSRSSSRYDDDDRDSRSSRYNDLEDDRSSARKSNTSDSDKKGSVAARVGLSSFQTLSFVTYGLEVGYLVSEKVALVGGFEAYSSRRTIPEALLEPGDPITRWDTIVPVNLGAQYHLGANSLRPYLGADLVLIPGYVADAGGMATGVRGRIGVNFNVADSIALNLNGSAGFWSGKEFDTVAKDMQESGMVPQISAGTVLRF